MIANLDSEAGISALISTADWDSVASFVGSSLYCSLRSFFSFRLLQQKVTPFLKQEQQEETPSFKQEQKSETKSLK